jgi:hypothetical protein
MGPRLRSPLAAFVLGGPAILLGLLAGCGGHSHDDNAAADGGVTAVEGTINGVSLTTSAYAVAIPDNSNATAGPTNQYTVLAIGIASKALGCTTAGLPNSTLIGISIKQEGTVPVGLGSYAINTDQTSSLNNNAALLMTDATCTETFPANCIGGTVTITRASDESIAGTFTLAFDTGEALHGTFTALICPSLPPSLRGSGC